MLDVYGFVLLVSIGPSYLAILVAESIGEVVWKNFFVCENSTELRFECIYLCPQSH